MNCRVTDLFIEKTKEFSLETHIAFTDFLKAFANANRDNLWEILNKLGYPDTEETILTSRSTRIDKCGVKYKHRAKNNNNIGSQLCLIYST